MATNKSLSRDDLFLLMKSYENSVTMNTTLLEQQKQLLEHQNEILDKQKNVCDTVNKVLDRLSTCAQTTMDVQENLGDKIGEINTTLSNSLVNNTRTLSDMKLNCETHHSSLSKEHIGINYRTYFGYAGMTSIILTLLWLASNLISQYDKIDLICKHLGI